MPKNRLAILAVAGVATLSGVTGVALGHGGHGGDRGDRGDRGHHGTKVSKKATCSLTATQLLTTANSPALAAKKTRLDAAVAAGRITQVQADARFTRFQLQVSLRKVVRDAQIAPLLQLLGMTEQELKDAAEAGDSLRDIVEEKGITRDQLRQALKDGRKAARQALRTACPKPGKAPKNGTTTNGTTTTKTDTTSTSGTTTTETVTAPGTTTTATTTAP